MEPSIDAERLSSTTLGPLIQTGTSYIEQFQLLFRRVLRDAVRNKVALIIKLVQNLGTTLIMVGLYSKLDGGGVVSIAIQNTTALLFFITITGLFGPLFGTIQAFAPEVSIVLRERMNNLYAMAPYYLAKFLVALPVELLPLAIGNTVAYWALKLNHDPLRYFIFLLITCGMTFSSIGLGFCLAAVSSGNVQAASAAVGPIAIIFLLLGGFYINTSTIPVWIRWFAKISYVSWSYESLAINQFHGYTVKAPGAPTNPDGTCRSGTNPNICMDGKQILDQLFNNGSPQTESKWEEILWIRMLCIAMYIVLFNFLAYLALVVKGPKYLQLTRS